MSEPGDGHDEDLVPPGGFPRLRRARLPLLVAGLVALVALIALNIAGRPGGTPSAGQGRVTKTVPLHRTSTSQGQSTSPRPSTPGQLSTPRSTKPTPHRLASCPHGASCAVVFHTPGRVAAAVRHALPTVTRLRTVTTFAHQDAPGSRLVTRVITGRLGEARLRIRLNDASANDVLGWNQSETAARTLETVLDHVRGRLVTVRVVGPPGYRLSGIKSLRALAADRRLAAPAPAE